MPVTFHHRTLPNGLAVLAEVDPAAHSAAAGFFVKTGARDETPALMGVSHFLEHMMFKGTDDLSADQINQAFDAMGASNNAYTSGEMTCFYAKVLPEHLDTGVRLLGQMMRPALRQEDFDSEKKVILEEIAMYKDDPFWVLYERVSEAFFAEHPLGHRVLGTNETITDLTRDQMRAYFDQRYSADNTCVALAGRVDFDAACGAIEAVCGAWRPTRVGRDNARPRVAAEAFVERDEKVSRGYALGLSEAPGIQDDRRYAAALAAQVLGGSDNSRLHWALLETGLAEEAQASYDPHDGVGQYFVFASCDPERVDEVWGVVEKEIAGLGDSLTEDDLAKIRSKMATGVTVASERPGDRMQRLGRQWTYLRSHRTLEEELARINAVTLADVREVLEAFPMGAMMVGRLLPAE
ncbi:MAG: pitrilysin family protein [Phycisphaerales bacterium]